ncbi:hypothetical protein LK12_00275 [Novosphingobium malaysiense]|uniref:RND transporter n=1 Tax=Novosphingobium malaysiense TaxID=1348853 RepID=A0A0B1ZWT1_9SPHN|nr:hypothetical protein LK12_00275 [Novosphingobium malaysiense]
MALLLMPLIAAGCSHVSSETGADAPVAPPVEAADGEGKDEAPGYWWQETGDAVMSDLVDEGLDQDRKMACEAIGLRNESARSEARGKRLDVKIGRLFSTRDSEADDALHLAHAYRHAEHRAQLAADIAEAYIRVRRLQEVLALRKSLHDQYADNAQIAAFRREAGLVSGIDTGLAGSLLAVSETGLQTTREQYQEAVANLARISNTDAERLHRVIGEKGKLPDIAIKPPGPDEPDLARRADLLSLRHQLIAQLIRQGMEPATLDVTDAAESGDSIGVNFATQARVAYRSAREAALAEVVRARKAVAAAAQREADLVQTAVQARRTVEEARLAYRSGTGDFATLFVAEAAALAIEEAKVAARADLADATIRMWSVLGGGWENADLTPAVPEQDSGEVLVCE